MKNAAPAGKSDGHDGPVSVDAFLEENRREIINAWDRRLAKWLPTTALQALEKESEFLDALFDEMIAILREKSVTTQPSAGRQTERNLVARAGASLSGFIHFFSGCGKDLLSLLERESAIAALSWAERENAIRQVETACAILIHREAHAFADRCGKMLRIVDPDRQSIANDFLFHPAAHQQSA